MWMHAPRSTCLLVYLGVARGCCLLRRRSNLGSTQCAEDSLAVLRCSKEGPVSRDGKQGIHAAQNARMVRSACNHARGTFGTVQTQCVLFSHALPLRLCMCKCFSVQDRLLPFIGSGSSAGIRYPLDVAEGSSLLRRSSSAMLPIRQTAKHRHPASAEPSRLSAAGQCFIPSDNNNVTVSIMISSIRA